MRAAAIGTLLLAVAVTAAILIQLGFKPLQACGLSLIANTAPVAWGGVGNPIRVLAAVTGLPDMELSAMAGRQTRARSRWSGSGRTRGRS